MENVFKNKNNFEKDNIQIERDLEDIEKLNLTFLESVDGKKEVTEQIKNILFAGEICDNITLELEDEMSDYFSDESIEKVIEYVNKKTLKERKKILAYPLEIRARIFNLWSEKIKTNKKTEEDFVDWLLEESEKQNYNIGYHVTNSDIKPIENNSGIKWCINGYEPDHRDNDVPMAYYSQDYMHRYRKDKNHEFLYIVRSVEDSGKVGGHKKDGDNRWGRAPGLDIIHKIEMKDVEEKVNKKMNDRFLNLDKDVLKRYIEKLYTSVEKENPSLEEQDLINLVSN